MKKTTTLFVSFFFVCLTYSQVSSNLQVYTDLTNPDLYSPAPLTNITGGTAACGSTNLNDIVSCRLFVVNNSVTDTFDVVMKRYILQEVSGSQNAMTWAFVNLPPLVSTTSPWQIFPEDTADFVVADYLPNGFPGETIINYHFYNNIDTNDYISTTVYFNPSMGLEDEIIDMYYVYPNPSIDFLNISTFENNPELILKITDFQGKIIKTQIIPEDSKIISIDLQTLSPSIYFYSIYERSILIQTNKFIKQ